MEIDFDAYLDRIGHFDDLAPDIETLTELHFRHPAAIPFENLSTLMRDAVPLDLASLQSKFVVDQRGGYCFEQNCFFAAVLEHVGFSITPLAARVVWNRDSDWINPRTHMILLVDTPQSQQYIADVGFGGVTLTAPLVFEPGIEQQTRHERFRLIDIGGEYELQVNIESGWRAMYQFDLQPQLPIDIEVLNYYVSTHPNSHFLTTLMAGRPTANGRYALSNRTLTSYKNGAVVERRTLDTLGELKSALSSVFGIRLPDGSALDTALAQIIDNETQ